MKEPLTAFDFFAGCGGFSCGYIQAGWKVVGALEFEPSAAHTYMHNLCSHPVQIYYTSDLYRDKLTTYFDKAFKKGKPEKSGEGWIKSVKKKGFHAVPNFFYGDITEISGAQILEALGMEPGELDCVFGGPPCQGYSTANMRNRKPGHWDKRNELIFHFAWKIVELQPKTFTMENVPGIKTMRSPSGDLVLDVFMEIIQLGTAMNSKAVQKVVGIQRKRDSARSK